jgi:hypothetical protein
MDLRVRPETAPADLVAVLGSYATVLARVIDGRRRRAAAGTSAGLAEASGFAAMACAEPRHPAAPVPVGARRRRPVVGAAVGTIHRELRGRR